MKNAQMSEKTSGKSNRELNLRMKSRFSSKEEYLLQQAEKEKSMREQKEREQVIVRSDVEEKLRELMERRECPNDSIVGCNQLQNSPPYSSYFTQTKSAKSKHQAG